VCVVDACITLSPGGVQRKGLKSSPSRFFRLLSLLFALATKASFELCVSNQEVEEAPETGPERTSLPNLHLFLASCLLAGVPLGSTNDL
jgi:hypothetical protein